MHPVMKKRFNQAAKSYLESSEVQQLIAEHLVSLMQPNGDILDLGCGASRLNFSSLGCDWAMDSLDSNSICADFHALPFFDEFDWIVSNMALHWSHPFEQVLSEVAMALKANGNLAFSLPISTSFQAFQSQVSQDLSTFCFPTQEKVDLFCRDKFQKKHTEIKSFSIFLKDFDSVVKHFKQTGCHLPVKGLWTPRKLARLKAACEEGVTLDYEILFWLGMKK